MNDVQFRILAKAISEKDERTNGHFSFHIQKWVWPLITAVLGAAASFIIHSAILDERHEVILEEHSKALENLQKNSVTKDEFQSTRYLIEQIQSEIRAHMNQYRRDHY